MSGALFSIGHVQPRKGGHARGQRGRLGIAPFHSEVMYMPEVIQIIQSLGFPIACVVAMFAMWQREVQSHREEMEKLRTTLEEQSAATTDALNNNTIVLNRILERLGED